MDEKKVKITFFGDSICTGQGISIHKGWVPLVSIKLAKEGINTTIINSSVNGRTTRQALEIMPYEIQNNPPDILVIQFGMNDCNYWESDLGVARVSLRAFKANLNEIIDRAFRCGVKKICLNTNHPTGRNAKNMKYTNITYQESNVAYNKTIRDVYLENNNNSLFLCDVEKHFGDITDDNFFQKYLLRDPDLLHLSEEGHLEYCQLFYSILEKMIFDLHL